MTYPIDRRTLMRGAALAGAAGLSGCAGGDLSPGRLEGADVARGHRLRNGDFPAPTRTETSDIVIAGGGVAGLSAAWRLVEAGFDRFRLLELEDETGGNARAGRNAVSAYPLGAHYLPVPNRE